MKTPHTIDTVMSTKLKTVEEACSLKDIIEIFKQNEFRHLPVIERNEVVGIISESDVLHYHQNFLPDINASHIMKRNPKKITSGSSILETTSSLLSEPFHAYPVVDEKDKLIGIISTTDLLVLLKSMLEDGL